MIKKKILLITSEFPPQPGGIGNHAYNLAIHLDLSKYQVTVIADQRSNDGSVESCFDNELPFEVLRIKLKKIRTLMYINRLYKTFTLFKNYQYVIATGKFSIWNVAFINTFFRKKTLAIVHGTEVNLTNKWLRKSVNICLSKFSDVIAVSNYTKSLINCSSCNVKIIPNGINNEKWHKKNITKEIKGTPVLTTVGRLSERKGQKQVIKHLQKLKYKYPNVHYHCVGLINDKGYYDKLVARLNLNSNVTFHSALNHEELLNILSQTDIFVMLSKESVTGDVEGFGIAILEANALGVPAIGSRNCGIEEAISENQTGKLINASIFNEFLNSIETILSNRIKFSQNSKKWAETHDWNNIIKKYIELIG